MLNHPSILMYYFYENKIAWLKNNTQPSQTLQTYWKDTAKHQIKNQHNLMELYPALKKPTGHILASPCF